MADEQAGSDFESLKLKLEYQREELKERRNARIAETEEKRAQRLANTEQWRAQLAFEEKKLSSAELLKRMDGEFAAGNGIRFTVGQATVVGAILTVIGSLGGAYVQAWRSGNEASIQAKANVDIAKEKSASDIRLAEQKSAADIQLAQQKFLTDLVAKATQSPDRDEQIRTLKFYVNAGLIDEPYASKIKAMNAEFEYPGTTTIPETPTISRLIEIFGMPVKNLGQQCAPIENGFLRSQIATEKFRDETVTLLKPALESFLSIIADIRAKEPVLLEFARSRGGLCARLNHTKPTMSPHSFGTALDIVFEEREIEAGAGGKLPIQDKAFEYFERAGWVKNPADNYPGHIEVSLPTIERWLAEGKIRSQQRAQTTP